MNINEKAISMKVLNEKLKALGVNGEEISLKDAEEYYKKVSKKEWERIP